MADLSPTQAASQLGLSASAIYKAIRRDELPARWGFGRRKLIAQRDIDAWMATRAGQANDNSGALNGLSDRFGRRLDR